MAITSQPIGDGATVQYNLTTGAATDTGWTTLCTIEKVNGNPIKADKVKTTKISDLAHTSQPGIPDFGSFKVEGRFNAAMAGTITGWMNAKTMFYGRLTVVDNGTSTGSNEAAICYVEEFDPFGTLETSKEIISSISLAINGAGTITPHA